MSRLPPTRTSPERPPAPSRRPRRAQQRRYRGGVLATLVVLALACAGFAAGATLRGPRLASTAFDAASAVSAPGTLRLVFDQPIATPAAGALTVTPTAAATVTVQGTVALVAFAAPLAAGTHYRVALADVRAVGGGGAVSVAQDVTTAALPFLWVDRASTPNRVLRATPGGGPQTVASAPRIADALPLSGAALVLAVNATGTTDASIVSYGGGAQENLLLPALGIVDEPVLVGTSVFYRLSTPGQAAQDEPVYRLDLAGTHISTAVTGLDGKPVTADALFADPRGQALILHASSGDVSSLAVAGTAPPTLLGSLPTVTGLSADGAILAGADANGPVLMTLADAKKTPATAAPLNGAPPYLGDLVPLDGHGWLERAIVPAADLRSVTTSVAVDDGTTARSIYTPVGTGAQLIDMTVSPNQQYALVESSPSGAASDAYPGSPRPADAQVSIVEIATGKLVAQWPGVHPRPAP